MSSVNRVLTSRELKAVGSQYVDNSARGHTVEQRPHVATITVGILVVLCLCASSFVLDDGMATVALWIAATFLAIAFMGMLICFKQQPQGR
jgi:hypothetical protein